MLALVAYALFVRAFAPDGWMPANQGGIATLAPCVSMADAMPGQGDDSGKMPAGKHHPRHVMCSFASMGARLPAPDPAAPVSIAADSYPAPAFVVRTIVTNGRTAVLPPPATGPPFLT